MDITNTSDKGLMEAVRTGSPHADAAFRELYRRYADRMYRYVRKVVNGDTIARDLLQDTFLKFLTAVRDGQDIENTPAFLMRIVRNLCIDHQRKSRMELFDPATMEQVHIDNTVENNELHVHIDNALQRMPEDYRDAIVMHVYGGLSYAEICEATNSTLPAVRNRISRARMWLRTFLTPLFKD